MGRCVPAGQLLRQGDQAGTGGPARQRIACASRQRSLRPPRASPRGRTDCWRTFVRPTRWETSGCSRWGARAVSDSPPREAGTSGPNGRPMVARLIYSSEHPFFRSLSPGGGREPARGAAVDRRVRPLPRLGLLGRPPVCLSRRPPRAASCGLCRLHGPPAPTRYFANGFNLAHARCRRTAAGWRTIRRVGTRRGVRPVVSQREREAMEGVPRQWDRSR